MPFRKTYKRKAPARSLRRTRRFVGKKSARPSYAVRRTRKGYSGVGRTIPFAARFSQKLPYTSLFTSTVNNLGIITNGVYCLNGLYDPDVGGIGHQPLGFDQMCPAIYNNYIVHGCKWTIRVFNVHGDAIMCGVHVSKDGSLPYTSQESLLEAERQRTRICNPASTANSVCIISGYTSLAAIFGISKREVSAGISNYQGTASANPSTKAYIMPFFWNTNTTGSAVTTTYTCQVQLTYYTTFFSPVAIAQS